MKKFDIYIVGVGGQGVLSISEFLCLAASNNNYPINYFPTKGMSQRGGFVRSQVRIGREVVGPSMPPKSADMVVSMEISETLKALPYLKRGGEVLLYGYKWLPTDVMLGRGDYPELETVKEEIAKAGGTLTYLDPADLPVHEGLPVRDNIFVLGGMLRGKLAELFPPEDIAAMISNKWPKAAEANAEAFQAGLSANA